MVLSGGACVSIYSERRYVSVDLVNLRLAKRRRIREAMEAIGFSEQGRHFAHPDTVYLVEFPPGPLAVGSEPVKEVVPLTQETGTIRMISATDCVKDRLTWYYHSDDAQCLEQASLVAHSREIDLEEIRRWSEGEGKLSTFESIEDRLKR